jgi:hypothetical protein
MLWRWCVPLASAGLIVGSVASATAAAAAPAAGHPGPARLVRPAVQLVSPAVQLIRPGVQVGPASPGTGSQTAPGGPLTQASSSTNWSGYAASGKFTKVSASWVEPTGHCSSGSQYSSFWVGLDGYNSSSVEQTGSEVDCSGGTPQYYSWYEMYPAYPVNFSNTVRPGDHFTGSVTFNGGSSYTLVLSDTTRGWSHTVNASLTGAANSSAEVIAEAPSSSSGVLPLANFGTVNFSGATVNGSAIGNASPTEIVMVDSSGRDKDTVSALSSGENFSATWQRSN